MYFYSLLINSKKMLKNKESLPEILFLTINGKQYKIKGSKKISIYHILVFLGYKLTLIAVEYNGKIVSRTKWKSIFLKNNRINILIS